MLLYLFEFTPKKFTLMLLPVSYQILRYDWLYDLKTFKSLYQKYLFIRFEILL